MKRKTIFCNTIQISYLDNEIESNTTILFVHGNSLNSEVFNGQFKDKILNNHRLVAMDLPGHGQSEWRKEYSIRQMSNDIIALCKKLKLTSFILVGHSLGGHLIIQSVPKIEGCIGLFLIGTPPVKIPLNMNEAFMPHPVISLLFKGKLTVEETNTFAESLSTHQNRTLITNSITGTDPNFREMMMVSIMKGDLNDETQILEQSKISVALVYGVDDVLVNKAYVEGLEISNLYVEKPIFISESRHIPHLENWEEFNRVLLGFILEVLTKTY